MNTGHYWTAQELRTLKTDYEAKPQDIPDRTFARAWGKAHGGLSIESVRGQLSRMKYSGNCRLVIQESAYPVYNEPLVMVGDALVLPDIEFPFHQAEFLNKCLALAEKWNIKQAVLAGDVLHFDSLSGWEPNWTAPNTGGLTADAEAALMEFAKTLPPKRQGEMFGLLGDLGQRTEGDGASTEMGIARRELRKLAEQFDKIDIVIGNHEGRLLRALNTTLDPGELKRLLELGDKWRIASYYYSYLDTPQGRYQVEHPKSAASTTAAVLAAKFHCHVLMGHSHHFSITTDVSGEYFAAEIGCCVDETRLPYAAQRHTRAPAHSLGAAIIRNGYPTILTRFTDWERL